MHATLLKNKKVMAGFNFRKRTGIQYCEAKTKSVPIKMPPLILLRFRKFMEAEVFAFQQVLFVTKQTYFGRKCLADLYNTRVEGIARAQAND